ncbi:uncharacterized protein [Primulina eburnea]|uniref:uncharacterized protein n=1 Tax=Primulina eburnea TaxID=1245227 RepID=UPI003C6C715B
MEHPFFPTTTTRAEALRWLTISEKLLSARDLMGSKSFATRARDSDPTLTPADQILAIVDTLLVGDSRIGNNQQDWYSILRLTPQHGRDSELIASQYRNLALILNPQRNKFPFAEQAFRLVVDAWSVLSDPSRKSIYDKELAFYLHSQQQQQQQPDPFHNPIPTLPQNFMFFGPSGPSNVAQPQVHAGGSSSGGSVHFPPQVQQLHMAQQQVDSVSVGSTREQQNFMSFASPSNLGFGSPSGSKSSQEPVYKQTQPSYSGFPAGNLGFASWSTQEQVNNNKQKEALQDYPSVDDKTKNDACASENVEDGVNEEEMETVCVQEEGNEGDLSFWTTCPYCFYVYEYPREYADCTLRCQNCRRAFQAVVIPPPPTVDGQEGYFCCWGFLPLGVSMENWEKNRAAASTWTPFSPMFSFPGMRRGRGRKNSGPRVYYDDDDVFVEMSEPSDSDDADWQDNNKIKKKKMSNIKGKGSSGMTNRSAKNVQVDKGKNVNAEDGFVSPNGVEVANKTTGEPSKKGATANARKQPGRVAKNFGKLDLNVEFSNETEEPAAAAPRANQGNGPGRGEDDNIEGIGFFDGLDEFLSSLPILNVVGDDKVVKAS